MFPYPGHPEGRSRRRDLPVDLRTGGDVLRDARRGPARSTIPKSAEPARRSRSPCSKIRNALTREPLRPAPPDVRIEPGRKAFAERRWADAVLLAAGFDERLRSPGTNSPTKCWPMLQVAHAMLKQGQKAVAVRDELPRARIPAPPWSADRPRSRSDAPTSRREDVDRARELFRQVREEIVDLETAQAAELLRNGDGARRSHRDRRCGRARAHAMADGGEGARARTGSRGPVDDDRRPRVRGQGFAARATGDVRPRSRSVRAGRRVERAAR
jgi:hypothetical protein